MSSRASDLRPDSRIGSSARPFPCDQVCRGSLSDARHHFEAACSYVVVDDVDERLLLDAMSMRLFAGLESLTRLPDDVADRLFGAEWPEMRGLRHRIAHGYGLVDPLRVRVTIEARLRGTLETIERALGEG